MTLAVVNIRIHVLTFWEEGHPELTNHFKMGFQPVMAGSKSETSKVFCFETSGTVQHRSARDKQPSMMDQ